MVFLAFLLINCKRDLNENNRGKELDENLKYEVVKNPLNKSIKENKQTLQNKIDCYSNTKITNLPITKDIIDGNNVWNNLDCDISDLKTRDYLRLPDIKDVKVFVIGDFNFDDFRYTLITLKNNKVIAKKDIGFAIEGDKPNTVSEFVVDKDYVFSLNNKSKMENDFKIIKTERFRIDENGLIVVVK